MNLGKVIDFEIIKFPFHIEPCEPIFEFSNIFFKSPAL